MVESHRRAKAGRILIDVEIVVEMGNPRPFDLEFWIEDDVGTVIVAVELHIVLFQKRWSQRNPLFSPRVELQLEFGEERLAENRGADPLDFIVDQIGEFLFIARRLLHLREEELLIEGRGDFSDEKRILRVDVGLIFAA